MTEPVSEATNERRILHQFPMYYDVFMPDDLDGKAPLIIATHGYGGAKESMMKLARKVAPA